MSLVFYSLLGPIFHLSSSPSVHSSCGHMTLQCIYLCWKVIQHSDAMLVATQNSVKAMATLGHNRRFSTIKAPTTEPSTIVDPAFSFYVRAAPGPRPAAFRPWPKHWQLDKKNAPSMDKRSGWVNSKGSLPWLTIHEHHKAHWNTEYHVFLQQRYPKSVFHTQ